MDKLFALGIVALPIIIILVYLYIHPLTVPCVGCGKSGIFHKCAVGTGEGSQKCADFQKGQQVLDDIGVKVSEVQKKAATLKQDILAPINKTLAAIQAIGTAVENAIPPMNIKPLSVNIKSCPVGTVDVCKELNTGMNDALKGLNAGIDITENAMNSVIEKLNQAVFLILSPLQKKLDSIFHTVVDPWMEVKDDIIGLTGDVQQMLDSVNGIGIMNLIQTSLANRIQAVFPFFSLGLALFVAAMLIAVWVFGGIYGFIRLVVDFNQTIMMILLFPFKMLMKLF